MLNFSYLQPGNPSFCQRAATLTLLITRLSNLHLQDHGAPQQAVEIQEVVQEGNSLDVTTAARDLKQGKRYR